MNAGISSQVATVDYLQLLTVQLQNQDPIDPVDQEGLINDLTQFSMLEGVENLNASFENMLRLQEISQGMSLVGKTVQFEDAGELKSGRVDEFFTSEGAINLMVDGNSVPINQVIGVTADPA